MINLRKILRKIFVILFSLYIVRKKSTYNFTYFAFYGKNFTWSFPFENLRYLSNLELNVKFNVNVNGKFNAIGLILGIYLFLHELLQLCKFFAIFNNRKLREFTVKNHVNVKKVMLETRKEKIAWHFTGLQKF